MTNLLTRPQYGFDGNFRSLLNPTTSCFVMFLVGALLRIDVFIMGRLAVGELILIAVAPFTFQALLNKLSDPFYKKMVIFLVIWIVGVIMSDFVNQSAMPLFLRGIARPMLCLIILFPIYYFAHKDPRSLIYFFIGIGISGLINFIVPTDFRAVEVAEFAAGSGQTGYQYYAYVYTPAAYALSSIVGYFLFRINPLLCGVFQIGLAAAVAPIMSRTSAAVFFLVGIIVITTYLIGGLRGFFIAQGRIRKSGVIKGLCVSALGAFIMYYLYAFLAMNQYLGEGQYNKFVMQSNTVFGNTPWGTLMAGRHYTVGAILRIIDNPIFGAGSWPFAGDHIVRAIELVGGRVTAAQADPYIRDIGHSIIFGIWAQNGPLVLPFMIFAFVNIFRVTLHLVFTSNPFKVLFLCYLIVFSFGFFFNNFNSLSRVMMIIIPVFYDVYIKKGFLQEAKPMRR